MPAVGKIGRILKEILQESEDKCGKGSQIDVYEELEEENVGMELNIKV